MRFQLHTSIHQVDSARKETTETLSRVSIDSSDTMEIQKTQNPFPIYTQILLQNPIKINLLAMKLQSLILIFDW